MCQPLLLLLTRPRHQQPLLPHHQSPMLPQVLAAPQVTCVDLAASHVTYVAVPVGCASAPATVVGSTLAVAAAPVTSVAASVTCASAPAPAAMLRWSSSTPAVMHAAAPAAPSAPAVAEATPAVAYAEAEATPAIAHAQPQHFQDYFAGQAISLPTQRSLGVDANRPLEIYTWGTAFMHAAVPGVLRYNFDATVLDARGGDADMRAMTGLDQQVQANLAGRWNFEGWLAMVSIPG